jgi:hypothetical protein
MHQASNLRCLLLQVGPSHLRKLAPVQAAVCGGGKRDRQTEGRGLHTLVPTCPGHSLLGLSWGSVRQDHQNIEVSTIHEFGWQVGAYKLDDRVRFPAWSRNDLHTCVRTSSAHLVRVVLMSQWEHKNVRSVLMRCGH